MQQLPVWSYANRNQEGFISLIDDEKNAIIRQYYNDMKTRRILDGKQHNIFVLLDAKLS